MTIRQIFGDRREPVHGVLQFGGKLLIARQLAQGAFPGIHVIGEFTEVGDGLVGVVIERFIFQKFSGRAFSLLNVVNNQVQLVYGRIRLLIELITRYEFANAALAVADVRRDALELIQSRV